MVEGIQPRSTERGYVDRLAECGKFILDRWRLETPQSIGGDDRCHLLTVVQGVVDVAGDLAGSPLGVGQSCLIPASIGPVRAARAQRLPYCSMPIYRSPRMLPADARSALVPMYQGEYAQSPGPVSTML